MPLTDWKNQARQAIIDWYVKNNVHMESEEALSKAVAGTERAMLSEPYFDYIHRAYELLQKSCPEPPDRIRFLHLGSAWSFAALEIKEKYAPLAVTAIDDRGRYYWTAQKIVEQNPDIVQGITIPQPWLFSLKKNYELFNILFVTPPFMMENNYHARSILTFQALQCIKPGGAAIIQRNKQKGNINLDDLRSLMLCAGFRDVLPLSRATTPLSEWDESKVSCLLGIDKQHRSPAEIKQTLKATGQDIKGLLARSPSTPRTETPTARETRIQRHIENKETEITTLPSHLLIVTDNRCNLRCAFCNVPDMLTNRKLSEVIINDIEKNISGFRNIILSGGEPLLQPTTYRLLRYAAEHKSPVIEMISNMNFCRPGTYNLIVEGLSHLNCSLDAACDATYKKLRVNGDFQTATNNLRHLARLRSASPQSSLHMTINFIVNGYNFNEIFPFAQLAHDMGMDRIVYKALAYSYTPRTGEKIQIDYTQKHISHTVLQQILKTKTFCAEHNISYSFTSIPYRIEQACPDVYALYRAELEMSSSSVPVSSSALPNALNGKQYDMPSLSPFTTLMSYSSNDAFFCCEARREYRAIRIDPGKGLLAAFNEPLFQQARRHFYNREFDKVCLKSCSLYKEFIDRKNSK